MFFSLTGIKPQNSLYIGDNINDSLCAQAAGVDFALATWGTSEKIPAKYYPKSAIGLLGIVLDTAAAGLRT